ncbi:hypothetical protein GCM10022403_097860 [Streptomyces coacervatus]|uniref:Uncharacterized protein n=1 Tax=Streptomyces coacervatus TaxID=647381 RepID=A0ABP7JPU9_9ACTN
MGEVDQLPDVAAVGPHLREPPVPFAQRSPEKRVHPAPVRAGCTFLSILCQEGVICHCCWGMAV